ncbi:MAG TPA: hypothetical protein GXX59_03240, partial [Syntrophomonadaceae bacterium]|nr:hypothetical protein [Syntrophomonadaceae bacterium]
YDLFYNGITTSKVVLATPPGVNSSPKTQTQVAQNPVGEEVVSPPQEEDGEEGPTEEPVEEQPVEEEKPEPVDPDPKETTDPSEETSDPDDKKELKVIEQS